MELYNLVEKLHENPEKISNIEQMINSNTLTNDDKIKVLNCVIDVDDKNPELYMKVIKYLLATNMNLNPVYDKQSVYNNDPPLIEASLKGYHKICKLLIKHGADVNTPNDRGSSALIFSQNLKTSKLLIKHEANCNYISKSRDNNKTSSVGWTAFTELMDDSKERSDAILIAIELIRAGANINIPISETETCIDRVLAN